jgi:Trk K+ transport system NAD-binding subunit
MNSAVFIALRRLRAPFLFLIAIYAIGIVGFVFIPGVDPEGRPYRMGVFHAFYFLSYTASTIGFGELPYPFTDAQRMWATLVIYLSVVGWTFTIGSILALGRDRAFLHALETQRFARRVRALSEPFYIVCGFGETGSLIGRALDRSGIRFVVVEHDAQRVAEVDLLDFAVSTPALAAEAQLPESLLRAGLAHPRLRGVLAVTNDDNANLAIAIAVRLLKPDVPVLARARSPEIAANMASFGTDHIVNPFELFREYLSLLLRAPRVYRLVDRLVGSAASPDIADRAPPRGRWIVCGYGRFGKEIAECFDREGVEIAIIEPAAPADLDRPVIRGHGTETAPLRAAGVDTAVGIVAGTDNDINNLSIAVTARDLNPQLYVIVRQNQTANLPLFAALKADYTVVSRAIVAEYCIALVRAPLLAPFVERITRGGEAVAETALDRLESLCGARTITAWEVPLDAAAAPAVERALRGADRDLALETLLADPRERRKPLAAVALLLRRGGADALLPSVETTLRPDDRLLFAGTNDAREQQRAILRDENVRDYVWLGRNVPGGTVWRWLTAERRSDGVPPSA